MIKINDYGVDCTSVVYIYFAYTTGPMRMVSLEALSLLNMFPPISANELDMEILCFKVMTNVVTLVGADRGSLFLTRKEGGQKLLVSKLFGKECGHSLSAQTTGDVNDGSSLQDAVGSDNYCRNTNVQRHFLMRTL